MKNTIQGCTVRVALMVPLAALLCDPSAGWAGPLLGSAQSFAVLGYAGVTNTGPTQIYGNVGVSPLPLTSITGFPPGTVTGGSIFGPASIADLALADIGTAAVTLSGLAVTGNLSTQDLGNRTLTPGVYFLSDVTAILTGTLTLDALGDPNAHFVFQLAHALTTASGSVVKVINGNAGTEVYWVLGSSAALGSSSTFEGNIIAGSSIALDSTAKIECGRAFAQTESVTLIDNLISGDCSAQNFGSSQSDFGSLGFSGGAGGTGGGGGGGIQPIPEPGTLPLLSLGLAAGLLLLRQPSWRRAKA
jgi:Ice-binding-like/PEP-CTERM motif